MRGNGSIVVARSDEHASRLRHGAGNIGSSIGNEDGEERANSDGGKTGKEQRDQRRGTQCDCDDADIALHRLCWYTTCHKSVMQQAHELYIDGHETCKITMS